MKKNDILSLKVVRWMREWEKEKQQVLNELTDVINDGELDWGEIVRKVEHAIEFIEKGEC